MTPERFRRVRDVADAALDRPETERSRFVAAACAGNATLRADVDSLLAAYDDVRGAGFMETPAAELASHDLPTGAEEERGDDELPAGTRLGAYELGDAVGRGGMGIVYRAVRADDEYRQVVAVKVIRRGMDTAVGQRRFREERQILAGLDHVGIARLLDGGTTEEGLPYLVMEYVQGEPIDAYCERARLGVSERLRLFLQVCAAVHHAHRNLVVHRDLKPGNVLVTAEGTPKLLDFGIARLLRPAVEPDALDPTVTAFRMLTPDYASPEQVRGESVTTATDVYSLGVLLYELLCGQRPYRAKLVHEVMAAICEQDPERPSAVLIRTRPPTTAGAPVLLHKKLSGDLDTIVLKALRKAPNERYASVETFAEDVTRHLEGRPVRARPHTLAYRTGKFVRRNPSAVATATFAVVALLGAIVATTRQARIAEANRARAERRFDDVRKIAHVMMFDIHDAIAKLPESTPPRKVLVTEALGYLDSLATEAGDDASLQRELALGYQKMGDVLGLSNAPNLGDAPGALKAWTKAQAARERLLAREPNDVATLREFSVTLQKMSRALSEAGEQEAGAEHARRAMLVEERLLALDPGPAQEFRHARSIANLGWSLWLLDDTLESGQRLRQAIGLLEPLAAAPTADTEVKLRLAVTYGHLARLLAAGNLPAGVTPDPLQALELQRQSTAGFAALAAAAPADRTLQRHALVARILLAEFLVPAGDRKAAGTAFREGFAVSELLARTDATNQGAQRDYAWAAMVLGEFLARDEPREALTVLARAADVFKTAQAVDPTNQTTRAQIARTHEAFATAHVVLASNPDLPPAIRLDHWREARSRLQEAQAHWKERAEQDTIGGADAGKLDALAREIARCDAALGRGTAGGGAQQR